MKLSAEQQQQVNQITDRIFQNRKYKEPKNYLGREITGDVFYDEISRRIMDITKSRTCRGTAIRNEAFNQVCDQLRERGFKLFS